MLGDPVAHSLSPRLHSAALAATGIVGTYIARRVDERGLAAAVADIRAGVLDGANVTMPHKRAAAALCDRLAGPARRIGAVNTLVRVGDEVVGHITDVDGVRRAWEWEDLPEDGPVVVLGGGGAAAAACIALEHRDVAVSTRRPEASRALVRKLGFGRPLPWASGIPGGVVVNATPLGMRGERLPDAFVTEATGLLDMAYGSGTTPAVAAMRRRGLPAAEGRTMLLGQAVESFRLWTGRVAPLAVLGAILDDRETAGHGESR